MRIQSEFWRLTLFTSLGLCPNACGGRAIDNTIGDLTTPNPSSMAGETEPLPEQSSPSTTSVNPNPGHTSPSACGDSKPYRRAEVETGLAQCDNGMVHRPSADVSCASRLPRSASDLANYGGVSNTCTSDSDCKDLPHGFCSPPRDGGQLPTLSCRYGCLTDSDCTPGNVCVCGDPVGECVPSNCTQDSDCGEGFLCGTWSNTTGIGCPVTFPLLCQTASDTCAVDADCEQEDFGSRCSGKTGTRSCVEIEGVACGRPFLVAGVERLATLAHIAFGGERSSSGALGKIPLETREHAGQHWAQIGLMEHASIAAFARFVLQLMHVGAPLGLLESAQRAMLDETEHAKVCFAIASELLGRDVGPGDLPVDHALLETSIEDVVKLVVREGCIGETIAAIEASEARSVAREPSIRDALEKIQADEASHAELAWKFVQWALSRPEASVSLHRLVSDEFSAAIAEAKAAPVHEGLSRETALAQWGVLGDATRAHVRFTALTEVIAPCAAELLRTTCPDSPRHLRFAECAF